MIQATVKVFVILKISGGGSEQVLFKTLLHIEGICGQMPI